VPGRASLPPLPRPPLWLTYLLSVVVAVAVIVLMIRFVSTHNTDGPVTPNAKAEVRANREAEILVKEDQAPRVLTLPRGVSPRSGLVRAVRADISQRIASASIDGPLQRVACARIQGAPGYRCTATAAFVNYDYLGVASRRAHRITLCRRDLPPVPAMNIPVSARCTR
jgi:hypothetical protein